MKQYRKGRQLECKIESVFEQLNQFPHLFAIRLRPEFVRNGKNGGFYRDKQPADYLIVTRSTVWLLDAKETEEKSWCPTKGASEYQLASMRKFKAMGYKAGFIVWFKLSANQMESVRLIEDLDNKATCISGKRFSWDLLI